MDAETKAYLDRWFGLIATEFRNVNRRLDGLDQRMAALEERMAALEERMGALERRVDEMDAANIEKFAGVHEQLTSMALKIEHIEAA